MRSRNPVLSEKAFQRGQTEVLAHGGTMTVEGSVQKTLVLLLIAAATGTFTWSRYFAGQDVTGWLMGGIIGGFAVAMVTIFRPQTSHVTAPLYAALEGLALGAISAIYHDAYQGVPAQAIMLTGGVLLVMLALYTSGVIKVTDNLRSGIVAATGAVMVVYIISIVLRLFGAGIPMIHESGPVGILFSLVVVGIAAFNLVLDFDFIETGAREGAPKRFEWFGAFGLMVTLVWLYLEILRLLGKMRD